MADTRIRHEQITSEAAGDGDVLTSDGAGNAAWEPSIGGGASLDDLTDVNVPAPSDQDVLTWDNGTSEWIAQAPPAGGVVDAADVTYTPAVNTDWDGDADPGNADDAFDQLAERVDDLEAGGALANHDHSGDAGDGGTFDAANLTAGASTDGQVLTSDGAGGAAWEDPSAGGTIIGTFSIPFALYGILTAAPQTMQFADENVSNRVKVLIPTPLNWDGTTDITIKIIWVANATGLVDFEVYIESVTEVDENTSVQVQNWTDNNLTWAVANKNKVMTITIAAANIAAGKHFGVYVRRNVSDANTGQASIVCVHVTTGLSF